MKRLALALVVLASLLLACVEEGGGGGTCHRLVVDCPGEVNDYIVCPTASGLEQRTEGGMRYFSYYNCSTGDRTPTLVIPGECAVGFEY